MNPVNDLDIALIQAPLAWQDAQANRDYFQAALAEAEGADLVVLPEMFTTGFSMDSAALAEPAAGPTLQWMREQAARTGAVITGSLIVQADDGTYRNRLFWVPPSAAVQHYDKRHLFRMAGEHKHYQAGERRLLVELKGWRIRPLVCYDLRFPVWSRDAATTDLLLYTANWPAARRNQWNRLLPARAIENLCYVAALNRIGDDGKGYAHAGDSQVLDFLGERIAYAADQPCVLRQRLSAEALAKHRERFPAGLDADDFVIRGCPEP